MFFSFIINLFLSLNAAVFRQPVFYSAPIIVLKSSSSAPAISADKAAVLSLSDRSFLFTKDADKSQPIASITKLMTALVFLDKNPGWEKIYKITESDKIEGGHLNLFLGDEVNLKDLFYTSLIASDNGATIALVHASGLSEKEFVDLMNQKAQFLGLRSTFFSDPIGLSDRNISTAREVAILVRTALASEEIKKAVYTPNYSYLTVQGRDKKIESTDYLLFLESENGLKAFGGKTGYTDTAGYCFAGKFSSASGKEFISVVLNSEDKNSRFKESRDLVRWILENYEIY